MLSYQARFRPFVVDLTLLMLAVVLSVAAFSVSAANPQLVAAGGLEGTCLPLGADVRGLIAPRGAAFDFLDHELAYAGGYGLRPVPNVLRGEEAFYFSDHELAYAGGYELRPFALVARGEAFDFLDHELAHAGAYGLCAAALASR